MATYWCDIHSADLRVETSNAAPLQIDMCIGKELQRFILGIDGSVVEIDAILVSMDFRIDRNRCIEIRKGRE